MKFTRGIYIAFVVDVLSVALAIRTVEVARSEGQDAHILDFARKSFEKMGFPDFSEGAVVERD